MEGRGLCSRCGYVWWRFLFSQVAEASSLGMDEEAEEAETNLPPELRTKWEMALQGDLSMFGSKNNLKRD